MFHSLRQIDIFPKTGPTGLGAAKYCSLNQLPEAHINSTVLILSAILDRFMSVHYTGRGHKYHLRHVRYLLQSHVYTAIQHIFSIRQNALCLVLR